MGVAVGRFDPRGFFLFSPKKRLRASWSYKKRVIPRSVLCGSMLFALGLISLFIGQIAADLELSRLRGRWQSKRVRVLVTRTGKIRLVFWVFCFDFDRVPA
ncbi:hypothetical protein COCNU_07G005370 [Cocos nucifera]|uniref:Uncharacterized protein n=1 Tax=Cocos nucifera TaxID=13894 RepID=A0A8K0N475_COCNU|nr:hypothetical protein COCNU_07G005370 [Cocos nucifera]